MIEKILIAIVSFVLGAVFLRFWDRWRTRKGLDRCLEEIVEKRDNIPFGATPLDERESSVKEALSSH